MILECNDLITTMMQFLSRLEDGSCEFEEPWNINTHRRDADYSALLEQPPKDMEIAIVHTEIWASRERLESLLRGKVMNPEAESWLMLVPILDIGSTTYAPRDYDSRLASLFNQTTNLECCSLESLKLLFCNFQLHLLVFRAT
ncbi:hypothetical protein Tco_0133353 [Tanacetum coccineum]